MDLRVKPSESRAIDASAQISAFRKLKLAIVPRPRCGPDISDRDNSGTDGGQFASHSRGPRPPPLAAANAGMHAERTGGSVEIANAGKWK
jgi:hypothetical protein